LRRHSQVHAELHLREARRAPVSGGNSIERKVTVAVPIEPPHQLAAVCVPERDRNIL
jgi:hypothetical protein